MMITQFKRRSRMKRTDSQPLKTLRLNVFGNMLKGKGIVPKSLFIAISQTEIELTIAPSA